MKSATICLAALALYGCAPTTGGGVTNATATTTFETRSGEDASVSGTVLDAKSREPVAGAEITGPGGAKARSDAKGRFLLDELPVGAEGVVEARLADGRRASVPLLPLGPGRLEIVLHVR